MTNVPPLPIDEVLGQVVGRLKDVACLVLRAPPGAGKTTRIPPALVAAGFAATGKIVVLQPRRVAARATAARIASEQGWRVGGEVGYQVRFESRVSRATRIEIVTEGILLRRLLNEPFLPDVAAVVFDEFHERSLACDLSLAMVRQVQQSVRPELKIVVMSATLAAEPIAAYLGNCPLVESTGRTFPVEVRYLPYLEKRPLDDLVAEAVEGVAEEANGDCLVFLPGVGEIRQCEQRLRDWAERRDVALLQLYGDLPTEQQDAVLLPGARRKVILSTNVAETSLTIAGVTVVIDSGLARVLRYDERTGLDRLELAPISQASAQQRAGRAGRTQPGICVRLWPEATQRIRPEFELPEVERVDLAAALLSLLCWVEPDVAGFPWYEAPPAGPLDRAERLLRLLGASDARGVTKLGRDIAGLPVHPRLGRMLIEGARQDAMPQVALAAALLSERDPFSRPARRPGERRGAAFRSRSDVLDRVHALEAFETSGALDTEVGALNRNAARQILRVRDQLIRISGTSLTPALLQREREQGALTPTLLQRDRENSAQPEAAFLRSIFAAYPDRLARRREPGNRRGVMVGGRGVRLADEVALADEELYVCVDVDAGQGEALVRQASAVDRAWLPVDQLRTETVVEFLEETGKVAARKRVLYDTLVLEESQAPLPQDEVVAAALASAAAERLHQVFPNDNADVSGFRARVQCLASWMPNLNLPSLSDDDLRALLPQLAHGRRSFAELRSAPWLQALKSLFSWQQLQTIEREAPERIEVPSGSRIALAYEPGRPPILAVRIQEIFGLLDTPRIAGGRVPVLMHLLAPNMRVAQVTDDLRSFWTNTYALVRKDLRARYPKHSWPEDPFTAQPQQRPGRKS